MDWRMLCEPQEKPDRLYTASLTTSPDICDLKGLCNKQKTACRSGDREELRRVQRDLRLNPLQVHGLLQYNTSRDVWTGMKKITGFKVKDRKSLGRLERTNQLDCLTSLLHSLRTRPRPTTDKNPNWVCWPRLGGSVMKVLVLVQHGKTQSTGWWVIQEFSHLWKFPGDSAE